MNGSTLTTAVIFTLTALFGLSAIYALWWAFKGGQFSDFQAGADSIFDADEPPGVFTDSLAGKRPASALTPAAGAKDQRTGSAPRADRRSEEVAA